MKIFEGLNYTERLLARGSEKISCQMGIVVGRVSRCARDMGRLLDCVYLLIHSLPDARMFPTSIVHISPNGNMNSHPFVKLD